MYIVLSPAKRLYDVDAQENATNPVFWKKSRELARQVQSLSVDELEKTMHISAKLGKLNFDRFQSLSMNAIQGTPAIQTFAGDTYIGMETKTLKEADITWAQSRIGILSGLYGVLRPLDSIEPYRLEMGTKLKTDAGKNLYEFWGDRVRKEVEKRAKSGAHPTLVNLASVEYFSVLKGLSIPYINPIFKEEKNGKYKVVALKAKRARGSMARYAIDNRIDDPEQLKAFSTGGYQFSKSDSDKQNWVFLR